jgi:hypothetical protein
MLKSNTACTAGWGHTGDDDSQAARTIGATIVIVTRKFLRQSKAANGRLEPRAKMD